MTTIRSTFAFVNRTIKSCKSTNISSRVFVATTTQSTTFNTTPTTSSTTTTTGLRSSTTTTGSSLLNNKSNRGISNNIVGGLNSLIQIGSFGDDDGT
ncbi:hypothetical protein CYY_009064 [Polysphondylium violaceum]|uniref:Uncharacterized protein n=1 Tax=Polysphondylium violaceum TaxID=133409 RepID=A0A8J4UPS1_9MYCE|nr:hypothetical protein CYY_009064 [Polysphondylium violaceum]